MSRNAQGDLQLLAEHLSTILGRAQNLDAQTSVPSGGRSDAVDDRHEGLATAIRVMHRLAAVPWQPQLVLVYAYLVAGPEARKRAADWDTRVAMVFATPGQRRAWLLPAAKSMGAGAAKHFGMELLSSAERAYTDVISPVTTLDGRWLSGAIDAVTRLDALATIASRDLVRAREQNRCAPPIPKPGVPKNRKERRSLLRTGRTGRAP
jgi:hypothetical protein